MALSDKDNKKIEVAKKKYSDAQAAGDSAGMEAAHKEAENIRANYGYSGGADGSQHIVTQEPDGLGQGGKGVPGTSTNYGTYKSDLDKLTAAQRKARVASLKQARQKALDNLATQEQEIKPTYQNARNLTSASSQTGARSFGEYLANRGLANSGAAAQGEINRQSALQNNLGNINVAEANAFRDIANQRTQIENNYVADLANANAAIDENYYANLLNNNEQKRAMVEQLRQQANAQYAGDYQQQINNLLAQGYSPDSLEVLQLQALRGNKIANNLSNATNPSIALQSIQAGNINYNNAAALGWTVQQAQEYYNNLLAQQQAQAQAEAEQQAWTRYQEEQKLKNSTALNNAQVANYYDQINKRGYSGNDNQYLFSYNDAIKTTENMANATEIQNYIDNLAANQAISPQDYEKLYLRYNLGT